MAAFRTARLVGSIALGLAAAALVASASEAWQALVALGDTRFAGMTGASGFLLILILPLQSAATVLCFGAFFVASIGAAALGLAGLGSLRRATTSAHAILVGLFAVALGIAAGVAFGFGNTTVGVRLLGYGAIQVLAAGVLRHLRRHERSGPTRVEALVEPTGARRVLLACALGATAVLWARLAWIHRAFLTVSWEMSRHEPEGDAADVGSLPLADLFGGGALLLPMTGVGLVTVAVALAVASAGGAVASVVPQPAGPSPFAAFVARLDLLAATALIVMAAVAWRDIGAGPLRLTAEVAALSITSALAALASRAFTARFMRIWSRLT